MNRKLLNTALMLTSQKLQNNAVVKALEFLLPSERLNFGGPRVLRLEVTDLKRNWFVQADCNGYQSSTASHTVDVTMRAKLAVILAAQDYDELRSALDSGQLEISATAHDKKVVETALYSLNQKNIDALVERCYAFFKLKPKPRFDIKSVSIDQIKSSRDIDWIRDQAIRLESTNLTEALRLMEIAHQARPNGPVIQRKVEQYRSALQLSK